ncbi:hypothetical protein BC830DRAFT_605345 [Chytriomyces sp. MP71]|nr:hypothetical protein BC830DRAFT_605345 [Chytriomyces sp. MP71]
MKDLEATATKSLTADPIEPPVFKMPAFDIIQVRNAPPPICIECEGKTERKVVKDMPTMIGLNCTNPECDIYNAGPFKLQDIPTNEPFDHELHAKCKALLHGKSPEMRRYQIAQLIDKTSKYAFAQTFVITTTLIAAGIGANPIPFVDAPLLIATQLTLVNSICSVYGFRNASTYWGLAKNVLATPILGLIGADMIKILPGLGTIVGGIADVIICATMTISLGIATVRMCDGLLTERNARGNGIGEGRPVFVIDAAVGKVFKEVYTSTKDAIKSLARNGKLSKESLMGMMESNGGVKLTEKPDEDDLEGAKELEGLAHDLVIHEREEVLKESPGKEGAATETPSNVVGGNPVDSDKVEIAVSAEVVD